MPHRVAILDDYQHVALDMADWRALGPDVEVEVFHDPLGDVDALVATLQDFDTLCLMRERTKFPRAVIERLLRLKLIITTGMRNVAIDVVAAGERGIVVCGTGMGGPATAELVFAHMLEFARKVGLESATLKSGGRWQTTVGIELSGKTLGVVGLGNLGRHVTRIAIAFGMKVIAWSENLTPEKCEGSGASYANRADLFASADFISINLQLSDRTRGLIVADDLARMKPTAFLINTARGPIVDEAALLDVLANRRIAGAGLDVFGEEPLPLTHPLRSMERAQLTPHLGYVTFEGYRNGYGNMVENIAAFRAGTPIRVISP